jgi:general transcription factor 3C polypeptide 3 (transcription factor C subunit 4)
LFQQAFDYYQALYPQGTATNADTNEEVLGGGFGLMELLVLADLYNSLGDHENAIGSIRKGCRWLQGRQNQKYWDACEDDREFDIATDHDQNPIREGVLASGMYPLDVNARHRLAVARIKMGDLDEGKVCVFSIVRHHKSKSCSDARKYSLISGYP